MRYIDEEKRPAVFSSANYAKAVFLHAALFAAIWYFGSIETRSGETVIPIDLSIVVHENLDGDPDEPPPEAPPEPVPPEPESPKPPEPEPEPPKPPEPVVQEAVVQEQAKTNIVKKVEEPKPPKQPETPKPPKETREQRIARMRASARDVKTVPQRTRPVSNGRTEMRPKDWEKLLMQGYRPAAVNSGLDASEAQRCMSYIKKAFYDKWEQPAWTDRLGTMHLEVDFGSGGRILGYRLVKSSGDPAADRTVMRAASQVGFVRGLTTAFLENNKTVTVVFTVKPEM